MTLGVSTTFGWWFQDATETIERTRKIPHDTVPSLNPPGIFGNQRMRGFIVPTSKDNCVVFPVYFLTFIPIALVKFVIQNTWIKHIGIHAGVFKGK